MNATRRVPQRSAQSRYAQTLTVFATGILAEAVFVVSLGGLCGIAVMAVLLAGG